MKVEKNKRYLVWALAVLFVGGSVFAVGCQPGDDGGGHGGGGIPGALVSVGIDVCGLCHGRQTEEWVASSQHGTAFGDLDSPGHPTYAQFLNPDGSFKVTSTGHYCAECHDPLGDGHRLQEYYTGNVDRPVIGCESCHGGGSQHFGIGEIPFSLPDETVCGQCHYQDFDHNKYHPNGDNIFELYTTSGHASSLLNGPQHGDPDRAIGSRCSRCHTDEGFRKYVGDTPNTMAYSDFRTYFDSFGNPDVTGLSDITCRTCHDGHRANGDQLTIIDPTVIAGETQSSQFNTCTSCHLLVNDTGAVQTSIPHSSSLDEQIIDTHAAVPGDLRENRVGGTGPLASVMYVKKDDEHACAACHNPHSVDNTQNEQWAKSGHGDLGNDTAWNHYPWKDMYGGTSGTDRQACQRCHTSTGFKNFADMLSDGGTTYVPKNVNDYSYLATWQYETLYCWACHAVSTGSAKGEISVTGDLRNPGQLPTSGPLKDQLYNSGNTLVTTDILLYPVVPMSGDTNLPDAGGSNVCLACHSGRENGAGVAAKTAATNWAATSGSLTLPSGHHAIAGAILYREMGYEYYMHYAIDGDTAYNYTSGTFRHNLIGGTTVDPVSGATVELYPGTGMNGPCVGCHMHANEEKHVFNPVTIDGATVELDATSCLACHGDMDIETVEEEGLAFDYSRVVLKAFLDRCGFKTGRTGDTPNNWSKNNSCTPTADATVGRNNMGASFNWTNLGEDGGAFVHNRRYSKRLIYDSIDWLDDNVINRSVATTLAGNTVVVGATTLSGATLDEAYLYLIPQPSTRNPTPAPRP